ncbi:protein SODIUM POTASSIUM ROOT DEFECTIVE 2-like [Primulina tabacum]|uniref:protein SODIUM POTASSIUM ROOT DEFECTIVE 2-like n=1 Tax=Primulina tabacum TaxID=48773 RepID=UPI003F59EEF1
MKKMDIFCTSQVSTAICLNMEQQQPWISPSPSSSLLLGRALDRHNPIIRDSRRIPKSLPPCNISQPPVSPRPIKNQVKKKNTKNPPKENDDQAEISNGLTTKGTDEKVSNDHDGGNDNTKAAVLARKRWNCTRPGDFISPPGSTRYLLSDKAVPSADPEPGSKQFPAEISKSEALKTEDPSSSPEQVVVLRVSLHCRGCEKKMRKHISRMEGVTSFDIDFLAKKVTVVGNITPLSVLSSISKVKNAQLWYPTIPSSIPQLSLSDSEFKKGYRVAGE